jgi:hypothetical protein
MRGYEDNVLWSTDNLFLPLLPLLFFCLSGVSREIACATKVDYL